MLSFASTILTLLLYDVLLACHIIFLSFQPQSVHLDTECWRPCELAPDASHHRKSDTKVSHLELLQLDSHCKCYWPLSGNPLPGTLQSLFGHCLFLYFVASAFHQTFSWHVSSAEFWRWALEISTVTTLRGILGWHDKFSPESIQRVAVSDGWFVEISLFGDISVCFQLPLCIEEVARECFQIMSQRIHQFLASFWSDASAIFFTLLLYFVTREYHFVWHSPTYTKTQAGISCCHQGLDLDVPKWHLNHVGENQKGCRIGSPSMMNQCCWCQCMECDLMFWSPIVNTGDCTSQFGNIVLLLKSMCIRHSAV